MNKVVNFTLVVFLSSFLAACGDVSSRATDAENTQAPPIASSLNWSEVAHEYYVDMLSPQICDMPFKIKFRQDGTYTAGPCTTGGVDTKAGRITKNELSEVHRRIDEVAAADLSENKCSQGEAFVGSVTDLTVDGVKRRVYRHFPDQLCYRGDKQAAESLNAMANLLAEKYYPVRQ